MVKQSPQVDDWKGLNELRPAVEQTLARNCRDRNELDDMVQETLLRAACFRHGLQDPSRLRSWVIRIAWNVMRDHVREERRSTSVDTSDPLFSLLESTELSLCDLNFREDVQIGGSPYDGDDVLKVLRVLLSELTPDERQLFESFYVQGLACSGTAQRLEISRQAIKMRLHRLRSKLRRGLSKQVALALRPCHRALEVLA
jgi:RNA polymerase sigma-70 factor (ECF subfamily)